MKKAAELERRFAKKDGAAPDGAAPDSGAASSDSDSDQDDEDKITETEEAGMSQLDTVPHGCALDALLLHVQCCCLCTLKQCSVLILVRKAAHLLCMQSTILVEQAVSVFSGCS